MDSCLRRNDRRVVIPRSLGVGSRGIWSRGGIFHVWIVIQKDENKQ